MAASVEHSFELGSLAGIKCADTLRPVKLVAGDREQVAADFVDVDWNLSRRLNSIGMKIHVDFRRNLSDLCHGLHNASLIICEHDRDQLGIRSDRAPHVVGIHHPAAIHRNVGDLAAFRCQMLAGVQDGMMLDGGSDDVVARLPKSKYRQIIGFGAAAGKHDL